MATIYLRLSTKTDKATSQHEVLMRFKHGKVDQRAKTNVFVQPDFWNEETQAIEIPKWRTITDERKQLQSELQNKIDSLDKITKLVQSSFNELDKSNVAKDWLTSLIDGYNFPKAETEEQEQQKSFFDWFELFLTTKNYPHGSTKSFRVLERALGRYQGYKRSKNKDFTLDICLPGGRPHNEYG